MASFFFLPFDHDVARPAEMAYDFDTVEATIVEVRTALSERAVDGPATSAYNRLSIEAFDKDRDPVREIRLVVEEIDKNPVFYRKSNF